MRRFISAVLLALFVLESTGAAVASLPSRSGARPMAAEVQFAFAQAVQSFESTHVGAFLMGRESQYDALHAPPPDFTVARTRQIHAEPPIMHLHDTPRFSSGQMLLTPLDRNQAFRYPVPPSNQPLAQARRAAVVASVRKALTVGAVNGSGAAGIYPWRTYEEGSLPGAGAYYADVTSGNLTVEGTDVDVHERGMDLAFRRVYNSMSQHTSSNADNSTPANYGDGWTNNLDANISFNTGLNPACSSTQGITLRDGTGAQYDFAPDCNGGFISPPGLQGTTMEFIKAGCFYEYWKKSGVVYGFWAPDYGSCTGSSTYAGYDGRLWRIWERNENNGLVVHYGWINSDSSSAANLNELDAVSSDGRQLTLKFANFSGRPELASLTLPDGKTTITYQYQAGDLVQVNELSNGSDPTATIPVTYTYSTGYQLQSVASPLRTQSGGSEGSYTTFTYTSAGLLSEALLTGWGNFTPNDDRNVPLQGGATGNQQISKQTFSYPASDETQLTDADGHATNWHFDTAGRVTEMDEWTGTQWLRSYAQWDAANELTASLDARSSGPTDTTYRTNYAYDRYGNTIAVAQPAMQTSAGYFRPTTLLSYDYGNNVIASCDPAEVGASGYDWTNRPQSDSLCTNLTAPKTRYTWNLSDRTEPYGYLTDTYTPLGYHTQISYDTTLQGGGDYGLPTGVQGDSISQIDGTMRQPTKSLTYDAYGNVTQSSTGSGIWHISYDTLNRVTSATDPDGITSRTCYYQNGQVSAKQTALQYQMDAGTVCGSHSATFSYDADGNELSETNHLNNTPNTTNKWYDGADRLVEVKLPYDSSDAFQNPWITRYIYDLTQGGSVSLSGSSSVSYSAYGNLYKTQELLMPGTTQHLSWYQGEAKLANTQFQDTKGAAFDALDRPITKYQFVNDVPQAETTTYDAGGYSGLPTGHCNAVSQCSTLTYYQNDAPDRISYSDGTPSEESFYDPDGRISSEVSSKFQGEYYSYDADSRLTSVREPQGGDVTSPATITYHYYADGTRSALDVSSSALNQASLFAYAYRADGKLQEQQINYAADAKVGNSALHFTYSSAGRLSQRSESGPAANPNVISFGYDSTTGVLTAANYPAAALSSYSYDAEGQMQTFNQNIYTYGAASVGTFTRTARGELLKDPRARGGIVFANGVGITGGSSTNLSTWDGRSGRNTGVDSPYLDTNGNGTGLTFSYDNAGRQTGSDQAGVDHYENPYDITNGRAYDAENHLISSSQYSPNTYQSASYYTSATAYEWGPNGHPIRIGSTPQVYKAQPTAAQLSYDTLHWDGGQLLFTTNAQGQVDDIKIGSIGDITPLDTGYSGLTFYDRVGGSIAFCHNATGASGADRLSSNHSLITGTTDTIDPCTPMSTQTMSAPVSIVQWGDSRLASGVGQGKVLGMPGGDGIADGVNIIQGVRNYDPLQGQWTTPDAYPGTVHDPMSQKSYMWNRGNAVSYADPSGYYTQGLTIDSSQTGFADFNSLPGDGQSSDSASQEAPPDPNNLPNNGNLDRQAAFQAAGQYYQKWVDKHVGKNEEADATVACDSGGHNCTVGELQVIHTDMQTTVTFYSRADGKKYVGWWHSHPLTASSTESLKDHQSEMLGLLNMPGHDKYFASVLTVATSLGRDIVGQDSVHGLSGESSDYFQEEHYTICSNCLDR